jgi:hypothetical protein
MPAAGFRKRHATSPVIRILGIALAAALLPLPAGPAAAATTPPVTTGSYDNTAPAITYTGAWRPMDSASDSGGSSSYLSSAGSASFTFSGTAVGTAEKATPLQASAFLPKAVRCSADQRGGRQCLSVGE